MKTTQKINNLVAVTEAVTKDKFRDVLRCVHLKGEVAEATNGFILIRVKGCADMGDVLIPAEAIKNAAKTIVKDRDVVEIDIEDNVGKIDNGTGVQNFTVNTGNFPDTQRVIPDMSGNSVSLGIEQLKIMLKAAKKTGTAWITFVVGSDPNSPVYFEGRPNKDFTGVIMPIRAESKE